MAKLNDTMKKDYTLFLNGLEEEYNLCESTGQYLTYYEGETLEETYWESQFNNKWKHYIKHVCAEDTPFTGDIVVFSNILGEKSETIQFPYMSIGEYLHKAETFLNRSLPTGDSKHIGDRVFGWVTKWGKIRDEVFIKFRKSIIPEVAAQGLYEFIVYKPVKGDNKVWVSVGGSGYYTYPIIDRKIISYGLCIDDPWEVFGVVDELPKSERELELRKITEELLSEANRQQLLQKSRNAQNYSPKNQAKGKNRYDRRNKSSISATVRDYNMIQMDPLFKRDILEFKIPVMGETDVYVVDVRVDGLLAEIRKQVMSNRGKLEFKVVLQSLMKVLNVGNVYIGCNCPDAKYRMAYQQTKNDYKAGYKETRPSDITNPNDTLGAGCKHVLLILANLDWAVKVASVINNYIKYCRENLQLAYAEYIFPKIYGVQYDKAVQMNLFENGLLPDDAETMKTVIDQGMQGKDKSGKFVKGNDMRFQKKELDEPEESEDQTHLDLDTPPEETEVVDLVPADEE